MNIKTNNNTEGNNSISSVNEYLTTMFGDIASILSNKLSEKELTLAILLKDYACYKDCILRADGNIWGDYLNIQDITDLCGFDYNTTKRTICSLKNKGVLGFSHIGIHNGVNAIITVNPYIYFRGTKACKFLAYFFGNTEWAEKENESMQIVRDKERSKGERKIIEYLNAKRIDFVLDKTFNDLLGVGGMPLSYDFYLKDYNTLIEFNGRQHEQPIEYFGGEESFKKQVEHDRRKAKFAAQHNIELIVIWYYDFYNIDSILDKWLYTLKR